MSLLIEDETCRVAELHARVLVVELVAMMTLLSTEGRPIEQKRVRAHVSDGPRFATAVLEQMEVACHSCPGLDVAVTRDDASIWMPFRQGLLRFSGSVRDVVERVPPVPEDLELCRRARRRMA